MSKNYWGYRNDTKDMGSRKYFNNEIVSGHLRQGWGYDESHKLPNTKDKGARRNLSIYNKVKKGDILLIPHLPEVNDITIVEAVKDFAEGYEFKIDAERGDFGHIFPVRKIKHISKYSINVHADLQRTLNRQPRRFWNITHCGGNIEELITSENNEAVTNEERFKESLTDAFENSFNRKIFGNLIMENAKKHFANETWEYALVEALKIIYQGPYFDVERVGGGKRESKHGTDILIKIYSLLGDDAKGGIAIQVKDWWGKAGECAIDQLNKADNYWEKEKGIKLIDKILIITKLNYEGNEGFKRQCEESNITPLFEEELSEILYDVGKTTFLKERD
jgi:hypothetical protein